MSKEYNSIIANLKQKKYQPIYFLMGEEPYYIDLISNYIEHHILNDAEKDFNQSIIYGSDIDIPTLISTAKRYPMMSERQVVIVKEAQHLSRSIDKLLSYAENPSPTTILVICYKYKTISKVTKLGKLLAKKGFLFKSEKVKDWNLEAWISDFVKQSGRTISPKNSLLLASHLGNDLSKIVNELDKAFINIAKGKELTADAIEKYIGISKSFNIFEFNSAIGKRDILQVNRIVNHFGKNPKEYPLVVTISMLYTYFSKILCYHYTADKNPNNIAKVLKIHPFIAKEYQLAAKTYNAKKALSVIGLLREFDMKSKGFNNPSTPPDELLKELAYRIMH